MADADVNEDLLDYEEEETTEQVTYDSFETVARQKFSFRLKEPRMELRPRRRAQ